MKKSEKSKINGMVVDINYFYIINNCITRCHISLLSVESFYNRSETNVIHDCYILNYVQIYRMWNFE